MALEENFVAYGPVVLVASPPPGASPWATKERMPIDQQRQAAIVRPSLFRYTIRRGTLPKRLQGRAVPRRFVAI